MSVVKTVNSVIVELARYLTASPHSRISRWQALRDLDDRLLADVGLSRSDVELNPWCVQRARACRSTTGLQSKPDERDEMAVMISDVVIRDATETDMADVQSIYEPYVLTGLATFEEVPPTVEEMLKRRAAVLGVGLPYLVAEVDGQVAGYSY